MNRMKNYRDLSSKDALSAGFQFEFYCQGCDFTWRSKFKPHRVGQITGWLSRLAFLFSDLSKAGRATGTVADASSRGAHDEAFLEAQAEAQRYFHKCPTCKDMFCGDCWNEDEGQCNNCLKQAQGRQPVGGSGGYGESADNVQRCPNCQVPSQGGRFCHECGFDMASTHKSCPSCGSVMPRAARFCTDCGHGF
ncbi:MAG TPA: zinc ribbon domain-containing protein [Aquabacterium sp.]|uniref:zinc ribbon domain-containing protein n=1 Tax=Aquabacterium sp. TaxID=1872578 RepID=UPI002E375D99|nr:zinc ribbon domain-containing protein [Aquabacterium sp.]HEX5373965.1 zinc ribbon domain-containing protein [Aquabacterium sp.]